MKKYFHSLVLVSKSSTFFDKWLQFTAYLFYLFHNKFFKFLKQSFEQIILDIFLSFYGNNFVKDSKVVDITGIDIDITIIFPPKSILFAILLSPESLHILTAYSVKIEIPVIFNKIEINPVSHFSLSVFMKLITPI